MSDRAPDVVPALRYRDVRAAIEWLERAFGFETVAEHRGEDGAVAHAELRLGSGMVMLGPARNDELRHDSPRELGGITGSVYVRLDDVAAHVRRAREEGAEIVRELSETDYGSTEYSARDPEGHLWHFGDHRPGAGA